METHSVANGDSVPGSNPESAHLSRGNRPISIVRGHHGYFPKSLTLRDPRIALTIAPRVPDPRSRRLGSRERSPLGAQTGVYPVFFLKTLTCCARFFPERLTHTLLACVLTTRRAVFRTPADSHRRETRRYIVRKQRRGFEMRRLPKRLTLR